MRVYPHISYIYTDGCIVLHQITCVAGGDSSSSVVMDRGQQERSMNLRPLGIQAIKPTATCTIQVQSSWQRQLCRAY